MPEISREERKNNVIGTLNEARSMELHAISQYMNQHYGLDNMDYGELAKNVKLIAIDEMRHAEMFAERIKELGGNRPRISPTRSRRVRRLNRFSPMTRVSKITPSTSTISFCWCVERTAIAQR